MGENSLPRMHAPHLVADSDSEGESVMCIGEVAAKPGHRPAAGANAHVVVIDSDSEGESVVMCGGEAAAEPGGPVPSSSGGNAAAAASPLAGAAACMATASQPGGGVGSRGRRGPYNVRNRCTGPLKCRACSNPRSKAKCTGPPLYGQDIAARTSAPHTSARPTTTRPAAASGRRRSSAAPAVGVGGTASAVALTAAAGAATIASSGHADSQQNFKQKPVFRALAVLYRGANNIPFNRWVDIPASVGPVLPAAHQGKAQLRIRAHGRPREDLGSDTWLSIEYC